MDTRSTPDLAWAAPFITRGELAWSWATRCRRLAVVVCRSSVVRLSFVRSWLNHLGWVAADVLAQRECSGRPSPPQAPRAVAPLPRVLNLKCLGGKERLLPMYHLLVRPNFCIHKSSALLRLLTPGS